jgi:hypothetical protein
MYFKIFLQEKDDVNITEKCRGLYIGPPLHRGKYQPMSFGGKKKEERGKRKKRKKMRKGEVKG